MHEVVLPELNNNLALQPKGHVSRPTYAVGGGSPEKKSNFKKLADSMNPIRPPRYKAIGELSKRKPVLRGFL